MSATCHCNGAGCMCCEKGGGCFVFDGKDSIPAMLDAAWAKFRKSMPKMADEIEAAMERAHAKRRGRARRRRA